MPIQSPGRKNIIFENLYSKNLALLGAFCLFLCTVEYLIPKPMPFMRIGLANLPLMLAIDIFPLSAFLVLICIKVLGQALITGTLFSYIFLFSLTGTFLSALIMFFLRKIFNNKLSDRERITFIGIGTVGAMVSNISQLALARVFIFRDSVIYIAPVFLLSGLVTGIVLGVFCEIFAQRSQWYRGEKLSMNNEQRTGNKEEIKINDDKYERIGEGLGIKGKRLTFFENVFSARALFITGIFIIPALLFNPGTEYRVIQYIFFCFLVLLSGKKTNLLLSFFIIVTIIAFNLIIPYGRVIFSAGPIKITSGALTAGIHRAVTLCALVMLSKVTVRQDLILPGAFGELLCKSLRIFSVLMNRKNRITAKNFIDDIDRMMMELGDDVLRPTHVQITRTKPAGYIVLISVIIISWLPFLVILL
ncbi:MAG: Gx transporter family protein [Treponema sp.]|nr:Gx transporter family protein [Treponema sp.]